MLDGHGRDIDYVRISVTDRCNLRCVYCMPEEGVAQVPHEAILSYEELLRLCRIFTSATWLQMCKRTLRSYGRRGRPARPW